MVPDLLKVNVKIQPNAKNNAILDLQENNLIKIAIKSQPIEGKANKELILFLSSILKIPKTNIKIIKGLTSKIKTLSIETYNKKDFYYIINSYIK